MHEYVSCLHYGIARFATDILSTVNAGDNSYLYVTYIYNSYLYILVFTEGVACYARSSLSNSLVRNVLGCCRFVMY